MNFEIHWLGEPACQDRARVGGKAAHLSKLSADFRVPLGFCLTGAAFQAPLPDGLDGALPVDKLQSLLPAVLGKVVPAYERLAVLCGMLRPAVAVRSSATQEDSRAASFAGQYESYLNVVGIEAVAEAILRCWASALSSRAIEYRRQRGLPVELTQFAVLIQQFILADISAVVFSANPVTGSHDEIVINANWGLGESVVGGTATPDTHVVRKQDLTVVAHSIAEKQTMAIAAAEGTREVNLPRLLRKQPVLSSAQVVELAHLTLALEKTMGWPVDAECAYRGSDLYLLQCRPITTLPVPPRRAAARRKEETKVAQTAAQPSSSPLPVPENFPVVWERSDDERLYWIIDRMHIPGPVPPLATVFLRHCYVDGVNYGADLYDWPLRNSIRHINFYWYWCPALRSLPAPGLEALNERSQAKLDAVMSHLAEFWETECLSEIQQFLATWEAFDLGGATLPDLLAHLEKTVAGSKRMWEVHFKMFPFYAALDSFHEMSQELFGQPGALENYRLLGGFDNKSLETDRELWQLSRKAKAMPQVRQALEQNAASEALSALEGSSEGRAFLAEFNAFLAEYGHRGATISPSDPSWIEDPNPVIKTLKEYMAAPERDPLAEMAGLAAQRERLVAEARKRLKGYPQPIVRRFESVLKAAQEATVLQENHNFWIDQRCVYQVRRVLVEFGRRLAASSLLDEPGDVFFLYLDELRSAVLAPAEKDWLGLVRRRKAELEHFRRIWPPLELGTRPLGPMPFTPLGRAVIERFFGMTPLEPTTDPSLLRGHAASSGRARGPARVIRSLAEAHKLKKGDVLVAETAVPPWTPLFATAAAVVTDIGGVTSHCAVVAREYGIPAVLGTETATSRIRDSQLIEVDGSAGLVRILSS